MELAPIVLFVYNRPEHTAQTLNALANNVLSDQSTLFIYADGPKENASAEDLKKIAETRGVIRRKNWCKEVTIIESATNKGLAASIIDGVTEVVNRYNRVIVLEDDIVTSPFFLKYMNDALALYEDDEQALSIGSYNFFATDKNTPDTFFIPIPDCWGWATWKNRWQLFEPDGRLLLEQLQNAGLVDDFNLGGAYQFEDMLIAQINGQVGSWAIRWQAVAYVTGKLSLYPKYSVTKNIGLDGSGTHGGGGNAYQSSLFAREEVRLEKIPVILKKAILKKMQSGYRRVTQPSNLTKTRRFVKRQISRLVPPAVKKMYKSVRSGSASMWSGDYKTWNDAKKNCGGYDDSVILEKTKEAILKVKRGDAAYERDSVLFDKIEYNWPMLTILLKQAIENHNHLEVVDFGGSLGSSYFMFKKLLPENITLCWKIIEQPAYVAIGNKEISDRNLVFFNSIDSAILTGRNSVLLLSSVLQYLENPYDTLKNLLQFNFKYIIADRTAFIHHTESRLTVQHVPAYIYEASYPAWFFLESLFLEAFAAEYDLLSDFDPYPGLDIPLEDGIHGYYKGFIFKRKK